jgi:hypothetical protein
VTGTGGGQHQQRLRRARLRDPSRAERGDAGGCPGDGLLELPLAPITFLGFTFPPRQARRKDGVRFTSFLPAISKGALKKVSAEIRSWRLHRRVNSDGREIANLINPKIRGWMGYYGAFYISKLYPVLRRMDPDVLAELACQLEDVFGEGWMH